MSARRASFTRRPSFAAHASGTGHRAAGAASRNLRYMTTWLHDNGLVGHNPREDRRQEVDVLALLGLELAVELPLWRSGRESHAGVEEEGPGPLLEVDGQPQERRARKVLQLGAGEDGD